MNAAGNTFLSLLAVVAFPFVVFSDDSFSFSGRVCENVGCLEIVPPPIKSAAITLYDNQSCIINGTASSSFFGRSTSYRAVTDSMGYYRFEKLDADSFTCYPMNQIVEVEAEGYYLQRRDIVPERDSLLDFDLLEALTDSTVPVTVTVVAVDTTVHGSPIPLENYRIEIPDRYLSWLTPRVTDTTDENGKAEFSLSVVPYVDYHFMAKSLNGDNYKGESISNIASCMGNDITIPVHIPRTMIQQDRIRENGSFTVECCHNRFNSGIAISVLIHGWEYRQEGSVLHIFDLKGKSAGCFKGDAGKEIPDRGRLYTFNIGDLPVGIYLSKMNIGKRTYSEKLLLSK